MKLAKYSIFGLSGFLLLMVIGSLVSPVTQSNLIESPRPSIDSANTISATAPAAASGKSIFPLDTTAAITYDRSLKVTASTEVDSLSGGEYVGSIAAKEGKLVVVYFTAENTGDDSGDLTFTSFELVDAQDRTYSELSNFEDLFIVSQWLMNKGLGSKNDQLYPGASVKSAAVFRVAPDATGLVMKTKSKQFALEN